MFPFSSTSFKNETGSKAPHSKRAMQKTSEEMRKGCTKVSDGCPASICKKDQNIGQSISAIESARRVEMCSPEGSTEYRRLNTEMFNPHFWAKQRQSTFQTFRIALHYLHAILQVHFASARFQKVICHDIVACTPVARQRQRDKQLYNSRC
jgi:hypothetical protein